MGGFFPPFSVWNVTISKTKFVHNNGAIKFYVSANASICLLEVIFSNNNSSNTGLSFALTGKSRLMVSDSWFSDNVSFGSTFVRSVERGLGTDVLISNTSFINNQQENKHKDSPHSDGVVTTSTVGLVYSLVSSSVSFDDVTMAITLSDVEISHSITAASTSGSGGSLFIHFLDSYHIYNTIFNLIRISLTSNKHLGDTGGALYFCLVVIFT